MPEQDYYTKTKPCPICGRYKTAYSNKCFGFISDEGDVYCSRTETEGHSFRRYGKLLYRHSSSCSANSNTAISPSEHYLPLRNDRTQPKEQLFPKKADSENLNEDLTVQSGLNPEVWNQQQMEKEMDDIIWNRKMEGKWPYG